MNSFALYTHEYQGTTYEFVITRNARIAIEELELQSLDGFSDADALSAMVSTNELRSRMEAVQKALSDATKQKEQAALQAQLEKLEQQLNQDLMRIMPSVKQLLQSQNQTQDEYEIAKIILMNYRGNGDMTSALAEEVLENMESVLGFERFEETLLEIVDSVFTQIRKIKACREEIFRKQGKNTSKTLPMA